jgi:hypothetical protein
MLSFIKLLEQLHSLEMQTKEKFGAMIDKIEKPHLVSNRKAA